MRFAITIDKDGNECSRTELEDNKLPKNGFEHGEDGNFYKQLGDPRNISDEERKKEIEDQLRFEEDKKRWDKFRQEVTEQESLSQTKVHGDYSGTIFLESKKRVSLAHLYHHIINASVKFTTDGTIQFFDGEITDDLGVYILERHKRPKKIEVNRRAGCLRIWIVNGQKDSPDYVIRDCIESSQSM